MLQLQLGAPATCLLLQRLPRPALLAQRDSSRLPAGHDCPNASPALALSTRPAPSRPHAAGKACGDSTNTTCNKPDTCNASGVCQSNFALSTTICSIPGRPTADEGCIKNFKCDGKGAFNVTVRQANGHVCRSSTGDAACDPPETCTGTSDSCPVGECLLLAQRTCLGLAPQAASPLMLHPCGTRCLWRARWYRNFMQPICSLP